MTELGAIPIEWEVKQLESVSKITMGQSPESSSYNDKGEGLPFYQGKTEFGDKYPKVIQWCSKPLKIAEKDDVLFTVRAPVGSVNICKEQSCIGRGLAAIRYIEGTTNYLFLYYYLQNSYFRFNKLSQGSTFTAINGTELRKFNLFIPPLKEQQKIAAILSTVDDQIEQTDQLIEKTKELKKGLMQQLLTKGVKHTAFKKTKIGEIPAEWRSVKFKEVCSIVNGLVDPREKPYSDYPHIGNANIEKKSGKLLNYKIAKEENLISGKYLFNERHVLYGKINPQFAKVTYPKFVGLCSADMYPIECDLEQIVPDFLLYAILDTRFTDTMIKLSTRTGMPKVNRFEVEQYVFALPKVNEQKKIAKILSSVDEDIEGYEQEKAKYEELKRGLMQQLLTGKTRVKVD